MNGTKGLKYILSNTQPYQVFGNNGISISGIAYNSKKVQSGYCFVAIKGENTDGHNYIDDAIQAGANSIICTELPSNYKDNLSNIVYIVCQDTRLMLAQISNTYYDYPSSKMNIIGVTGTNGKTTTTYLIKNIVEQAHIKCGVIGTTGIYIGERKISATHTTPESLELFEILFQMYKANVEYVIIEVSSHSLVQHRVSGVDFDIAMFTNLTHDHLDYHKTIEEYAAAKKILFSGLRKTAYAVVNADSDWANFMIENIECKNIVRLGRNNDSYDFNITNEEVSLDGIKYDFKFKDKSLHIKSKLTGKFNIDNSAMALVATEIFFISHHSMLLALSKTSGAPGRMQKLKLKNGAVAFVDYAHTPDALKKALQACRDISPNSKLISVFGCGGDRDKTKRPEMGQVSESLADISIVTSDNPRTESPDEIIKEIIQGFDDSSKYFIESDRRKAIEFAYEQSNENDIILIAGKGHENYQVIGTDRRHFDDFEEISKFK